MNILAFRIVGVKTNYSTKEIVWGFFFEKGGAHAPVAPPLATALIPSCINLSIEIYGTCKCNLIRVFNCISVDPSPPTSTPPP